MNPKTCTRFVAVLTAALMIGQVAHAQLGIAATATNYTIDFDATVTNVNNSLFAGAGFEPGAPPTVGRMSSGAWAMTGWSNGALTFGGTQTTAGTDYTRGTTANAPVNTGGVWSFGGGSISGRALGFQPGGSDWAPGTATLRIQNNTAVNITSLDVSYIVHVRNDQGRSNSFNFSWSTDDATYNPVAALDLTSTVTADALGFVANNRNTTITGLNVAPGAFIYLRWSGADVGGSGSRDEFALDDIVVNAAGSPVSNTIVQFTSSSSTVSEGVGTTVLTMSITNAAPVATTVDVAITAGSAARVNGYTTQTVTFPANDGSNQTLTITVTDDAVYDGGGAVTFTLQNIAGGQGVPAVGSPSSHVLTITENEPSPLLINEVDYDMPGTNDSLEFVEILNTGLAAIDLNGFKLELVNGNAGGAAVYTTITLPSFSLPAGGYYVVGNDASIPNINLVTGVNFNFIQNGSPDAVGLRDPSNNLIDAVSYEGNTGAPYTEGTGIAVIDSDDATDGIGISRFPNGSDTQDNSVDWSRRCISPGAANNSSQVNCICTPPDASAIVQCIDDFSWEIVVTVNNTGSGATVDITNNVNGSSHIAVGAGSYTVGPFANNTTVNVTVAHQTFAQCNLPLNGLFNNCLPDCNNVVGGPDVPGAPCDDLDAGTENDVWSPTCVCAGTPITPQVGFTLPSSAWLEDGGPATIAVSMNIAPSSNVVVDITDLLTGSATSGADYAAFALSQLTFTPTDIYPYTQTVNVTITTDTDFEPTETVNLNLALSSGTATVLTSTHAIAILNDDLAPLRINEVEYDNAGTDNAEWIELKNIGNTAINLNGFKVELVNGNLGGAAVAQTINLNNVTLPAGGYYVVGNNAAIPNINQVVTPATNLIQNGSPDAIGLRDPSNTLIDAISYEGNSGAPYTEGTGMPLTEADDNTTVDRVIARYLDGNDTDDNSVDWKAWCATPGASNTTATNGDGDSLPDCVDLCPLDPNKIAPGTCGCGNPEPGASCNDNNPFTANDVIDGACTCVGTPVPCDNWTLSFTFAPNGSETTWQIVDATSPFVLASGGPYGGSSASQTVCVPQGACFRLTVNDSNNDGMGAGSGWTITDNNGRRIVDNTNNGTCFTSSATTGDPWCNQPASAQSVIAAHCGKLNWILSDVIIANNEPTVAAQWGIGDQTDDGYQFWFENPCGGYTRRILRNHATSGGNGPANALRATKLALSAMVTNPLPVGALLNVRVRPLVNGVYGNWGPACQFKLDPTACTLTKLNDTPSDPKFSCGATGKVVGASGNTGKIFAKIVTSGGSPATHYRFEISQPGEGYTRNAVSTSGVLPLAAWQTLPLLCGTYIYDVRVQASFNGGVSYCPYGDVCTVEITNNLASPTYCTTPGPIAGGGHRVDELPEVDFAMYPNPNRGEEMTLQLSGFSTEVAIVTMDVYDSYGKRVATRTFAVQDGFLNQRFDLGVDMAAGMYLVNLTAGELVKTERLVIQR